MSDPTPVNDLAERVMASVRTESRPSAPRSFRDGLRNGDWDEIRSSLGVAWHLTRRASTVPLVVRAQALALLLSVALTTGVAATFATATAIRVIESPTSPAVLERLADDPTDGRTRTTVVPAPWSLEVEDMDDAPPWRHDDGRRRRPGRDGVASGGVVSDPLAADGEGQGATIDDGDDGDRPAAATDDRDDEIDDRPSTGDEDDEATEPDDDGSSDADVEPDGDGDGDGDDQRWRGHLPGRRRAQPAA